MKEEVVGQEVQMFSKSSGPGLSTQQRQFDFSLAEPFIYRSANQETRAAYSRVICEFFVFVGNRHPTLVTQADVVAYREHQRITLRRKANTIATKLAIIRSFYEYLRSVTVVEANPASTRLVAPPAIAAGPGGRALTSKEVRNLLCGPDRSTAEGERDFALLLVMLRLSLRLAEVSALRVSAIKWSHGRWVLRCKIKGGNEEMWPLPKDVKKAIDTYLQLDAERRRTLHSDGPSAFLFQPSYNYRTLVFDKPLSARMIQKIVSRWGKFTGLGRVTPHDLRCTVVAKLLRDGHTYREVQMVTKHKDPKTIMRYDRTRDTLDSNPVNTLNYDE